MFNMVFVGVVCGLWALKAFPDSKSVLDKFQSERFVRASIQFLKFFKIEGQRGAFLLGVQTPNLFYELRPCQASLRNFQAILGLRKFEAILGNLLGMFFQVLSANSQQMSVNIYLSSAGVGEELWSPYVGVNPQPDTDKNHASMGPRTSSSIAAVEDTFQSAKCYHSEVPILGLKCGFPRAISIFEKESHEMLAELCLKQCKFLCVSFDPLAILVLAGDVSPPSMRASYDWKATKEYLNHRGNKIRAFSPPLSLQALFTPPPLLPSSPPPLSPLFDSQKTPI